MDAQVPKYRYLIARVSDGAFVMEVPFSGVSWERKINAAGSFSGSIAIPGNSALDEPRLSSSEDHFDLYNSTLPGKNAIYIMRNDQIVWGGIIWTRDYDITTKVINVTALEFVSYLYHRVFWKTFVLPEITTSVKSMLNTFITYVNNDQDTINSTYAASDTHNLMTYYAHSGTTITFTTEEKHGFTAGTKIQVKNHDSAHHSDGVATPYNYDGDNLTVVTVPNSRQFTITSLITASTAIDTTAYAVDSGVHCIKQSTYDKIQSASAVNLTTDIDNALNNYKIIGTGDNNPFEFRGHRMTYVGEIIENFAKTGVPSYTQSTVTDGDYPKATVGSSTKRVVKKQTTANVATLTTSTAHGFAVGNLVTVANVDSVFNVTNQAITAVTTTSPYTFSYAKTVSPDVPETLVGADFVSARFDFTVESSYDANTKTFNNVFKAWLVQKDINNPAGNVTDGASLTNLYGPSSLGANQFIFEHPGNIVSLTLNENAERSASRTWVVDNKNDLGDAATPFYGSYTNISYLNNLFPLLEVAITDRDLPTENDADVVPFAKEFGYRLAPPIGDYKITVNGSLDPEVGSYQPGDWCGILPHDEFINNRLRLPYENRNNILVRKIGSYKVNVPDNPAFPETVELELLVEWEVTE
jgi:hypothetical protein